jgi:predicted dienelactone hydrolase
MERLDPTRIGIFGHSAGAFTALVAAGGTPNLDRIAQRCRERPEDRACQPAPERDESNDMVPTGAPAFMHDPRIAPARVGETEGPGSTAPGLKRGCSSMLEASRTARSRY